MDQEDFVPLARSRAALKWNQIPIFIIDCLPMDLFFFWVNAWINIPTRRYSFNYFDFTEKNFVNMMCGNGFTSHLQRRMFIDFCKCMHKHMKNKITIFILCFVFFLKFYFLERAGITSGYEYKIFHKRGGFLRIQ